MPADNSPEKEPSRRGNADYRWAKFDSEAYFTHYYGEPHPDDDRVIEAAVEAIKQARPAGSDLDFVDVGTGPNLIPLFCALPWARSLTVWKYAESNVACSRLTWPAMRCAASMATLLGRHAPRLRSTLRPRGEPDAGAPRQDRSSAGIDLRLAGAPLGRRDHVFLRRVDHGAKGRVRARLHRRSKRCSPVMSSP